MYNVINICQYVIKYCEEKQYSLSNLKLQKLLYFIQVYFLLELDEPCFKEDIDAWAYGPVVPVSYHQYKRYGAINIPYKEIVDFNQNKISDEDKHRIEDVVEQFVCYDAWALVELTHDQDPWIKASKRGYGTTIDLDDIRDYFNE